MDGASQAKGWADIERRHRHWCEDHGLRPLWTTPHLDPVESDYLNAYPLTERSRARRAAVGSAVLRRIALFHTVTVFYRVPCWDDGDSWKIDSRTAHPRPCGSPMSWRTRAAPAAESALQVMAGRGQGAWRMMLLRPVPPGDRQAQGEDLARMEKGRRYDAATRRLVGVELRRLYEGGATLGDLARATGRSVPYVRALLIEAGAVVGGRRVSAATHHYGAGGHARGKGRHLDADARQRVGAELLGLYEAGASIRELYRATGRSYGFVHQLLLESGAVLRSRSG